MCVFLVVFFNTKAQNSDLLKTFINKNDIAIRSVQKYSINLNDPAIDATVKELLRFQIASVKLFSSNQNKSADIAYLIREKCLDFLTKNSNTPLEYFKLSDKETSFFSSPKPVDKIDSQLNKSELQKINSVDVKNPHLFDGINTRIN
jgi:hypothetical protein